MAVNKVIYGGNTLVDLTGDTVTAADLADGVKATGADGNPIVGLMQKVTIDDELSTTSTNPVQNKVIAEAIANIGSGASRDYLPLTGGTVTGGITASNFQTGTAAANYFQCRKFRGEGDANTYYHAVDFGYSGHDSVDFYEYDPNWNFYKCTTGTKSGAVLIGNINGNGWNGGARLTGAPTAPTAAAGTNSSQIATTAFVQKSLTGYVKSVNNATPDSNGNVTITVSSGTDITVDEELSSTSTNAIQNKAVYNALLNKVGTDIYSGFALMGATSTIAWRQGTQPVGSINASNYTGNAASATKATQDGAGNDIADTYAKKIAQNTWRAQQTFNLATLNYEQYTTPNKSTVSDSPATSTAAYYATGAFTLNLATLSALLSSNQSTVFTAYITADGDYALSITNGGTIKYIGDASDVAITNSGLMLNIFMTKNASGALTSIVQASKLT